MEPFTILLFLPLLLGVIGAPQNQARKSSIPGFVLNHAPFFHLHSQETYFPIDLATYLSQTTAKQNYSPVTKGPNPLTLSNLDQLNQNPDAQKVCLTTKPGLPVLPSYLSGSRPSASGALPKGATAITIITVANPAASILDAFYFHFYAYNRGNLVLNLPELEFGDHAADWEHVMIRFTNGVPQSMWFSQHANGEAFKWSAVHKTDEGRPHVYVANGTHASYASPGIHDHTIPNVDLPIGPLEDFADKEGATWDPIASSHYAYDYDPHSFKFTAYNGVDPTGWLEFVGRWGDEQVPDGVDGQLDVFGQRKYVAGPTGPRDKNLARGAQVCPLTASLCTPLGLMGHQIGL